MSFADNLKIYSRLIKYYISLCIIILCSIPNIRIIYVKTRNICEGKKDMLLLFAENDYL